MAHYRTLQACIDDLQRTGRLVVIDEPFDPYLEIAALQRRLYAAEAPAVLLRNTGTFPMLANLFGTAERLEYIFRGAIEPLRRMIAWGADPATELAETLQSFRWNFRAISLPCRLFGTARFARPKCVRHAPVLQCRTTLDQLPQLVSWPDDGGPFITLPQVYTQSPDQLGYGGMFASNLGMYRVQIAGNDYVPNSEAGLHYQLHRGIAAHHAEALRLGRPLPVNIFIGGAPAMTLAAVMPLPEGVSELLFAGMLGRHRIPMCVVPNAPLPIYAEADFCITGFLDPVLLKREGPFGDHLGYYSLAHEFPLFRVTQVYHRKNAVWPFTVVGRPPQEDSRLGHFIQELVGGVVPRKLPGVHAVHAVDEAGVHPLCLAIGTESYQPFRPRRAAQLHTLAHAILGFGQLSLAKFLLLVAREDDPSLDITDTPGFLTHLLTRVDWSNDLHFVTQTTCDTLDYTGGRLNAGSKLIITACGPPRRDLGNEIDARLELPDFFTAPRLPIPGVLVVEKREPQRSLRSELEFFRNGSASFRGADRFPLLVVVDHSDSAASLRDFLWTTFTKSDPATDIDGFGAFLENKHWGCTGPLVIDARCKAHHAPELVEVPEIEHRVEEKLVRLSRPGGPFAALFRRFP